MSLKIISRMKDLLNNILNTYHSYLQVLFERKNKIVLILVISLIGVLIMLPVPILVRYIIDDFIPSGDLFGVLFCCGAILFVQLSGEGLNYYFSRYLLRVNVEFKTAVRQLVYAKILSLKHRDYESFGKGDLLVRATRDIDSLVYLIPRGISEILLVILKVIIFSIVLLWIDYKLSLILSVFIPVAFLFYRRFDKPLASLAKDVHKNYAHLSSRLQEDIDNVPDLQANLALSYAHKKQNIATVQYNNSTIAWGFCNQTLTSILTIIPSLILTAIWLYAGFNIVQGNMSLGTIVSFMYVLALLYNPLDFLFGFYARIQSDLAILDRLQTLLSTVTDYSGSQVVDSFSKIDFDCVSICYGEKAVISDVSLAIRKDDFVLVQGPSGSGKTTLLNTIAGFYDDYKGAITVDGEPFQNISYQAYQQLIGSVPQQISIYEDTLKNNLTMGKPVCEKYLQKVLKTCSLEGLIDVLPDGLDSSISEKGSNLSGGQRQRIAVARMLLRKPSILLLDEPFNHLDAQSKHKLMLALIDYCKSGHTVIVASHDESWPKFEHISITMKGGRVIAYD